MEDAVRLNVNPPTFQRLASPELKFQGAAIVTAAPTFTNPVKSPDRLTTVGGKLAPLSHPVTWVAVLTEPVLRCAPPLIEMEPLIGAAPAPSRATVTPAPSRATAAKSVCLIVLSGCSCRGAGERKHTVGARILGAKPPSARRWVKAMAANRPRPADAKEPTTLQDNGGCCQVKRKSANTPETRQAGRRVKDPRRVHRHCSSDVYVCREVS